MRDQRWVLVINGIISSNVLLKFVLQSMLRSVIALVDILKECVGDVGQRLAHLVMLIGAEKSKTRNVIFRQKNKETPRVSTYAGFFRHIVYFSSHPKIHVFYTEPRPLSFYTNTVMHLMFLEYPRKGLIG